jgi:hypothetical protein
VRKNTNSRFEVHGAKNNSELTIVRNAIGNWVK